MADAYMNESSGESGSGFTKKAGPLPIWAWLTIILIGALGFTFLKSKKQASAASSAQAQTQQATAAAEQQYAAQTPPYVLQSYGTSTATAGQSTMPNSNIASASSGGTPHHGHGNWNTATAQPGATTASSPQAAQPQTSQPSSASSAIMQSQNLVTVPNTIGKWASTSLGVMSASGLKGSVPPPQRGKVHIVTSETPAAGTKVPRGSTVSMQVKTK